jgi:hypothetical protein
MNALKHIAFILIDIVNAEIVLGYPVVSIRGFLQNPGKYIGAEIGKLY